MNTRHRWLLALLAILALLLAACGGSTPPAAEQPTRRGRPGRRAHKCPSASGRADGGTGS